jgi:16S rRNA (guanine966-N2)-methyltransferase
MRIIAGEFGGRRIQAPPGEGTRPMLDRVREAMFSTLESQLGERFQDARVLDLFAGTGSLGIEALSRGAASARMVERDAAVARLLQQNVDALGLAERARVVRGDALGSASWGAGERCELIFFDPPYPMLDDARSKPRVFAALQSLLADRLASGGVLVYHAPRGRLSEAQFGPETAAKLREYGTNALWYLSRTNAGERTA